MKIKNLFNTPVKAIITSISAVALAAAIGTGSALAVNTVKKETSIGNDKAQSFALTDAGVKLSDAEDLSTEFKFKQGHFVYEVEFESEGLEYDYYINAQNGAVVKKSVVVADCETVDATEKTLNSQSDRTTAPENEYKYVTDAASEKTTDKDTDTAVRTTSAATTSALSSASNSDTKIGVEKAKEIAVRQAGVEKGNVVFLKAKLEKENGRYVYEIEFHNRKTEYEFEIDAYTGEVVSYDKENADSDDCISSTAANCNAIGLNNAKQIALKHAGLNSKEVVFSKAKLENDDGIQIYEIEMKKGKKEYEYKINAATGAIIECEIDY